MPYKDRERKLERMRQWREEKMGKGYGKWLYARRKLRLDDAERFEHAITRALDEIAKAASSESISLVQDQLQLVREILQDALTESMEAELAVGEFQEPDEEE